MVSEYTAYYYTYWKDFLPSMKLDGLPSFDGQISTFSNLEGVQDYFHWKQTDYQANNLYNTCFQALVHSGVTLEEAKMELCVCRCACEKYRSVETAFICSHAGKVIPSFTLSLLKLLTSWS